MALPDNNHVEDRKAIICPGLQNLDIKQLVLECQDCHRFFASCCQNGFSEGGLYKHHGRLCHHAKVVFTDGACTNNGSALARSGLGVTIGGDNDEFDYSWSIPVTDAVDVVSPRTSQRAELLAALEGLKMLEAFRKTGGVDVSRNHSGHARDDYRDTYLVVTDSEYVVKGMTEWLPSWKVCLVHPSNFHSCSTHGLFLATRTAHIKWQASDQSRLILGIRSICHEIGERPCRCRILARPSHLQPGR